MKSLIIFTLSFFIFLYFSYHFIHAHTRDASLLENTYKEKAQMLSDLTEQEECWKYKVRALHPESLDPDIAEESIRYVLNKGRSDEEVVLM